MSLKPILHRIKQLLQLIYEGLLHLCFPKLCVGCQRVLLEMEFVLCLHCTLLLPETGYHLQDSQPAAQRFIGRIPYSHVTAYAHFVPDGLLQHLLHQLKYKSRGDVGVFLGQQLGYNLLETSWLRDIDVLVPVPLHPKKEALRGYNQSLLIAEGIQQITQIPIQASLLLRQCNTPSQTNKSRIERVNNMALAFHCPLDSLDRIKHILLIDDMLTTGATIEACALAILAEKRIKISIATIGIAIS